MKCHQGDQYREISGQFFSRLAELLTRWPKLSKCGEAAIAGSVLTLVTTLYLLKHGGEMMTTNTRNIRILMLCLTLAVLAGMSNLALAAADSPEQVGVLTVTGTVTVNGKPATTGDIVAEGSEVQTAKGSSAVVSLGKLGRVEALPSTTIKLRYNVTNTPHALASIAILLGDGSVRVSTGEGMVNVESGMAATRASLEAQQNVFTVDRTCGNTLVSVAKGKVELRIGHSVKQIAAGGQDTAGQAKPGCTLSRNR